MFVTWFSLTGAALAYQPLAVYPRNFCPCFPPPLFFFPQRKLGSPPTSAVPPKRSRPLKPGTFSADEMTLLFSVSTGVWTPREEGWVLSEDKLR